MHLKGKLGNSGGPKLVLARNTGIGRSVKKKPPGFNKSFTALFEKSHRETQTSSEMHRYWGSIAKVKRLKKQIVSLSGS